MKTLNFEQIGVQEMDVFEVHDTQGGWVLELLHLAYECFMDGFRDGRADKQK